MPILHRVIQTIKLMPLLYLCLGVGENRVLASISIHDP